MNKKILTALEKVFAAEISGNLPFQSKAKIYADLADEGYLQAAKTVFGAGGRFPATVSGYAFTERGRMTYCMSCKDVEEPA